MLSLILKKIFINKLGRRKFLKSIGSVGVFLAGANLPVWAINTSAVAATSGLSYELLKPDQNGLMLMKGFTSRVVATTGKKPFSRSKYKWHVNPDGGATFPTEDGGWVYVSNSEAETGGVGAIRFNSKAEIVKSYSICSSPSGLPVTSINCAGGPTPWNTWLTCEEHNYGFTWECDPYGIKPAEQIQSLGMFQHEAAAVDPKTSIIYQTEDKGKSGFYRFVPKKKINSMGELSMAKGKFQVMQIKSGGKVKWNNVNDPLANGKFSLMKRKANKKIKYKAFKRGEGAWYHDGKVHFATTSTHQIWTYDIANETCKILYKGKGKLKDPDNIVVSKTGLVMAAEDRDNMEICGISKKTNKAFPIVRIKGHHKKSEVTGPAFDPSGTRLYFSSQRGKNGFNGITYEVKGHFNELI